MAEIIKEMLIEDEMKESYLDYAMSVIVSRALPDVKDGLKPVHRRILYAMSGLGLLHNKPFRKSAHVVGSVMAKYHPHGDASIYDTMVRMAQDFSLRYPLIDGQGNWGSIDGDSAAAQRYTEARLTKIAEEILSDLDKDTVDFSPNYDNSTKEPQVLPSKIPNLLLNGSSGIAVGMATNIPPQNLKEVSDAIIAMIENPEIGVEDIIKIIPGPDFPTGGYICGRTGIVNAYKTGRGRLVLRAKTDIEEKDGRKKIIVNEIPYQVNKTNLIETIAEHIREKRIQGISDLRDESDRTGMRLVIELKKGVDENVILNQLYKNSQLQTTFGVIMLALIDGQPKIFNIKDMIEHFIDHRKDVITRRTKFDLNKAEEKAHILEGLKIALANIDDVVKKIKSSANPAIARDKLMSSFKLTEKQALAILDLRLQKLTSLEQDKIKEEHDSLVKLIKELKEILASEKNVYDIIKEETLELKEKYGDDRRTEILDQEEEIEIEDLIPEEKVVVMVTHSGYIKKMPLKTYKTQGRGGRGVIGTGTKEDDTVEHLFTTSNHNYVLVFTNKGKLYWLKAYNIPTASRYAKGKAIVNLLRIEKGEIVSALVPVPKFDDEHYLLMATKNGLIKKTNLSAYSKPRKGGIIGIKLNLGDELVQVRLTPGTLNMIIASKKGKAIKFSEKDVTSVGRNSSGVRGMRLGSGDAVIGMEVALESATLLTVTENGFGKRTKISEYSLIRRGGKGVKNIQVSERNGDVVAIKTVKDEDEVIFVSAHGIVIRVAVKGISVFGRATQGVRLMRLEEGDKLTTVDRVKG